MGSVDTDITCTKDSLLGKFMQGDHFAVVALRCASVAV